MESGDTRQGEILDDLFMSARSHLMVMLLARLTAGLTCYTYLSTYRYGDKLSSCSWLPTPGSLTRYLNIFYHHFSSQISLGSGQGFSQLNIWYDLYRL